MSDPIQGDVTSVEVHIKWFANPVMKVVDGVIRSVTVSELGGYRPAITNNGTSNLSGYCYKYTGGDGNNGTIKFHKKDSIIEIQVVTEGCVIETVLFFQKTPGTIFYTTIADRFKLQSKAADNRTIRYLDTDPGPGAGNFAAIISAPLALSRNGGEGMMTGIRCDPVWQDEK